MKNTGFTLAEVLITLAIIGVIAAVTIPTLFEEVDLDEKEAKIRLNKTITAIDNATKMLAANELSGSMANNTCEKTATGTGSDCLRNLYCKYLSCVKKNAILVGQRGNKLTDGTAQLSDGTVLRFYNYVENNKCEGRTSGAVFNYGDTLANGVALTNICAHVDFNIAGENDTIHKLGVNIYNIGIGKRGIKFN